MSPGPILPRIVKAWAAAAAGIAVLVVAGVVTGQTAVVVTATVQAVATALAVYVAPPNAPAEQIGGKHTAAAE